MTGRGVRETLVTIVGAPVCQPYLFERKISETTAQCCRDQFVGINANSFLKHVLCEYSVSESAPFSVLISRRLIKKFPPKSLELCDS